MGVNDVLLWTSGLSAVIGIARSLRLRLLGWLVISGGLLAVVVAGWLLWPHLAGFVAAGLTVALDLGPSVGVELLDRLEDRQHYRAARHLATVLAWLHPADGWRAWPVLLRALELAQRGAVDEAEALLARAGDRALARIAEGHLLEMRGDWNGLVRWGGLMGTHGFYNNPASLLRYLFVLGETGRLDAMAQTYAAHEGLLLTNAKMHDLGRLYLFAYSGRRASVDRLLGGPLATWASYETRALWRAVAALAVGDRVAAEGELAAAAGDPRLRLAVEHLRARAAAAEDQPVVASHGTAAVVVSCERALDQERRFGEGQVPAKSQYVTYVLMAINMLVFLGEIAAGGSTDPVTLVRLGAFSVDRVLAGQWWGVIAFLFLHFGFLHLALNLFALYQFGRYIEWSLGKARYLLVYFCSGLAGALVYLILSATDVVSVAVRHQVLVGASGCIMGLVGATVAILWRGWRLEGAGAARRRLAFVGFQIAAQVAFDVVHPQVSFIAHATGSITGYLVAALMRHRVTRYRLVTALVERSRYRGFTTRNSSLAAEARSFRQRRQGFSSRWRVGGWFR